MLVQPFSTQSLAERRIAERRSCEVDAVTHRSDTGGGVTWGATLHDVSRTGVGLILCFPFRAGTYLAIDLKRDTFLAKVVRVEDQYDGSWRVGCEFIRPLTDGELERLSR